MGFIYSAGGIIIGRILVYLRGEGEAGAGIVIGILHYSSKGPKKIREKKKKNFSSPKCTAYISSLCATDMNQAEYIESRSELRQK